MCNPSQAALPTGLRAHLEARIASGALELPILPHIASQVLALSTSDDASKSVLLLSLAALQAQWQEPILPPVVATAMDVYHTQVGALLASTWALPPAVCESMVYHHDYSAAPVHQEAALITCLADRVA